MDKVLIADADPYATQRTAGFLDALGHEVVTATSGSEALAKLTSPNPEATTAIIDWSLPEVDGIDVCRRLRDRSDISFVYTILSTPRSLGQSIRFVIESGANDCLEKPIDPAALRMSLVSAEQMLVYDEKLRAKNQQLQAYAQEMEALANARARQLLHSERLASLGTLSAGVAHEINNPTTFISGNVQTLEMFWKDLQPLIDELVSGPDASPKIPFILEETPKIFAGMHDGVRRIKKIVSGLKSYARKDGSTKTDCVINDCVENALRFARERLESSNVEVGLSLNPALPTVQADVQQIEQVLINLLHNAADAMREAQVPSPRICLKTCVAGRSVCIVVQDNGPGVPPSHVNRIWNPFFTTKPAGKGTGLGLAICRSIIEDHAGRLTLAPPAGDGSKFVITLPIAESKVA